jgi:hypothetical protein
MKDRCVAFGGRLTAEVRTDFVVDAARYVKVWK